MGQSQSVSPNVTQVGPYMNEPYDSKQKFHAIKRENDNTTALEQALLAVHQKFAHISVPDDGSGARSAKGTFNPSQLAETPRTGIPPG